MKILVTGGTGYIGSHTCVQLLQSGYEVVILDNLANSKRDAVDRIRKLADKAPEFVLGDMCDPEIFNAIFSANNIDAVIHFAGLKAVGESVFEPLKYYNTNIGGTVVLLKAMQQAGVNTIVFSSSATVYGANHTVPYDENMPTDKATNPYGSTKIFIEQILRDVCVAQPNFKAILLRYFNPVGAHESGLLGENPNGTPLNLMPLISEVARGKREFLSITGNDFDTVDGSGVRDYIHVQDVASGHLRAIEFALHAAPGCEVFNLGTGRGVSVLELVRAFETTNGVQIPFRFTPRRPGDIANCYANVEKARRELGWEATRSVEDMCRDVWNYLTKNSAVE
jgi:UDP-glucose 4-epimerase